MDAGKPEALAEPAFEESSRDESAGVQAVETGIRILSAMIELGPSPMLKTIAEHAGMPPPKAHRYLASYCRTGLVDRNPMTGGYRLGPLAVRLGLAALRHLDVVTVAAPAMAELRDELGFTVGIAIWGTYGPTFVRLEETNDVVVISTRPGSVVPILSSATGRVFGAFMPRSLTANLIDAELAGKAPTSASIAAAGRRRASMTNKEVERMFDAVRARRMANVMGDVNRGIHALCAPIFDHTGSIAAAMAVMGAAGLFDASFDGPNAAALKAKADEVSKRLGSA